MVHMAVYAQGPCDVPPMCADSTAGSGLRGRRHRETATCLGPPWLRSEQRLKLRAHLLHLLCQLEFTL